MKACLTAGLIRGTAVAMSLVLLAAAAAASGGADDGAVPVNGGSQSTLDAQIAGLIVQLGDSQYAVRERAQEQLQNLGVAAFDALLEACHHEDVEIALRARFLIRSMAIQWAVESDPPAVENLLRSYDEAGQAERRNRMQQLARLDDSRGIVALCRLMRFESDGLLSKEAALFAMRHTPPSDPQRRAALAAEIRDSVGRSQRPAALWLSAFAQTLVAPEATLDEWDRLARAELATYAEFPHRTDRGLVRDLLRWQADLLRQLGRDDESLDVIRRTIDLVERDREELFDFVDWLVDRNAWILVDEVADRFPAEFYKHAILVYRLAEARRARGQRELADETALRARKMDPGQPDRHNLLAGYLTSRQLYDWSENEYRQVLESTERDSGPHLEARYFLSDMLFDIQHEFDAAEVLAIAVETIDQNPKVLQQLPLPRSPNEVRGSMHYYYAVHHAREGDRQQQIEHLSQAIKHNPFNPDFLIAMYRVEDAGEAWRTDTMNRIQVTKGRMRDRIARYEELLANARRDAERMEAMDELATSFNELAWLISNTEGDFEGALAYSQKSLELKSDFAPYLDTLGRCYYALGDLENAIKHQSQAVERAPYFQQIRRQLELFERELAKASSQQPASS